MLRKALVLIAIVLVGLGFLAPAAEAQYQPGQPGFILTPSTVDPSDPVTATGFGCPPGQPVEIYVGETRVTTTIAINDGRGSFTATFPAPPIAGQYVVTAKCGSIIMTNILNVLLVANITVTPDNFACGQQFDVVSTGYQPGTNVDFFIDSLSLGSATADGTGVARLTATSPTTIGVGGHTVRSVGPSQLGGSTLELVAPVTVTSCGTTGTLPITGLQAGDYLRSGIVLIGLGGLTLLAAKRRRGEA